VRSRLEPFMPTTQVKMHWVHENYWQPGPQGNDIQKTNVPNLRMRFRYDNHQEEVHTLV
jgi:AMP deaminase